MHFGGGHLYITFFHAFSNFHLFPPIVFHIKICKESAIYLSHSVFKSKWEFGTITERRTRTVDRGGLGTFWGSHGEALGREQRWGLHLILHQMLFASSSWAAAETSWNFQPINWNLSLQRINLIWVKRNKNKLSNLTYWRKTQMAPPQKGKRNSFKKWKRFDAS